MAAPRKRGGKVIMPNASVLDGDLSYRALGLLVALLARPAKASFDMRELAGDPTHRPGREGRSALLKAADELRAKGYLWTVRTTMAGRKGVRMETVVAAEPIIEQEAISILQSRSMGSENPTPVNRTPIIRTPFQSTPFLRKATLPLHYVQGRDT